LMDMAPTALRLFGVDLPPYLQGQPLFGERKSDREPKDEAQKAPTEDDSSKEVA
jgi:arylsulfatase A-like enzyme